MNEERVRVKSGSWFRRIPVWIRTEKDGDMEVVNEVIRDDFYGIRQLTDVPRTVFDVGAHIGTFTLALKRRFPDARVVAIEPHPRSFELLQKNIGGLPGVTCVNGMISYEHGSHLADDDAGKATGGGYTTSPEQFEQSGDSDKYRLLPNRCETYTVEDLFEIGGFDSVDLVKWDCEGGERDAFKNMEDATIPKLGDMVGEYHYPGGFHELVEATKGRFGHYRWENRGTDPDKSIEFFRAMKLS